jgi:hypothetical protein
MHCTIDSTCSSSASFTPYLVMSVFTALFVGALFLQSGWEKLNDWPGNLSWLKEHFRNTPIKAIVSGVLVILTGLELLSGTIIVRIQPRLCLPACAVYRTKDSKRLCRCSFIGAIFFAGACRALAFKLTNIYTNKTVPFWGPFC